MRTTITLEDNLARLVKERAVATGVSVSAVIAKARREVLTRAEDQTDVPPFRLVTVGHGESPPTADLDRTSALLAADDVASYGGSPAESPSESPSR